jgi:hypothetical protein
LRWLYKKLKSNVPSVDSEDLLDVGDPWVSGLPPFTSFSGGNFSTIFLGFKHQSWSKIVILWNQCEKNCAYKDNYTRPDAVPKYAWKPQCNPNFDGAKNNVMGIAAA